MPWLKLGLHVPPGVWLGSAASGIVGTQSSVSDGVARRSGQGTPLQPFAARPNTFTLRPHSERNDRALSSPRRPHHPPAIYACLPDGP
jgi:hypothetical protein